MKAQQLQPRLDKSFAAYKSLIFTLALLTLLYRFNALELGKQTKIAHCLVVSKSLFARKKQESDNDVRYGALGRHARIPAR